MPTVNDILASLSPEERALMARLLPLLVGRAANRRERFTLFLDLMEKIEPEQSWLWAALAQRNVKGHRQMVLNLANGRITSVELKSTL